MFTSAPNRARPAKFPICLPVLLVLALAALNAEPARAQAPDGGALRAAIAGAPALRGATPGTEALAGKALLVTFYASWCPPCTVEFRAFNEVRAAIGTDRLAIVAVNVHESLIADSTGRMERFLARTAPRFTVLGENPEAVGAAGGVQRIPSVFLFTADDRMTFDFVHAQGAEKMNTNAEEVLAALAAIGLLPD